MGCFVATINVSADVDGDYTYTVTNNSATITGYYGGSGAVTIPATLGGYPVVAIGDQAFLSRTGITSISMPDSVTSIGYAAFGYCNSLASITLSKSLISIGENAFFPAASLSSISLPEGLVSIGQYAFAGTALTSIYIPSTLSDLGYHAMNGISVEVSPSNPYYASIDGVLYDKAITTLIQCPYSKSGSLIIPTSVSTIADFAFTCSSLTSVSIPDHVTTIGQNAFSASHSLVSVNMPNGLTTISQSSFSYCYALTSVTIPDNVTTIEYGAFFYCINLASVTIGSGVTTIDVSAFAQCSSLTSIRFLGLEAPTSVASDWIDGTPPGLRGQADPSSNFPPIGEEWNGLKMGASTQNLPSAPIDLTAVFSNRQVHLTWNAPASDGGNTIASYQVYRSKNTTGNFIPIVSSTTPYHNDSYLEGGWTYWYEVSAVTSSGEGAHAIASVYVPVDPNRSAVPSAPRSLAYSDSNDLIVLSWQPPASAGNSSIIHYLVYRDGLSYGATTDLWFNDTDKESGLSYTYDVIAENSNGVGVKATISTTAASVKSLPTAPLDLSAVGGDGSVSLSWHAPASDGNSAITDYKIYVNDVFLGSTGDVNIMNYTVTGLTNGLDYSFYVTAVNEVGEGPWSASVESAPTGSNLNGFAWHNSTKGYSLLVPPSWSVQDDTTYGGAHADTLLVGPTIDGFQTNIMVVTGIDPAITGSSNYLSDQVTSLQNSYQNSLGASVILSDSPQYTTISNCTAVVFGFNVPSYNVHQQMAVIVDGVSNHYWIVVCSESITARSQIDPHFEAIIENFTVSSSRAPIFDVWLVIGILLAIGLLAAFLIYSITRARKLKEQSPGGEVAPPGPSHVALASYCTNCGFKLTGGSNYCPNCNKPIVGNGPNIAPSNINLGNEEKGK